MDGPRFIVNRAFDAPSDEERERPPFWRYWRRCRLLAASASS
ncbi:MAG: hypothetical protein R2712_09515 [Vicinamibacterales bacterium]